jgi:predicted HAD superfamily phosphohydrolase
MALHAIARMNKSLPEFGICNLLAGRLMHADSSHHPNESRRELVSALLPYACKNARGSHLPGALIALFSYCSARDARKLLHSSATKGILSRPVLLHGFLQREAENAYTAHQAQAVDFCRTPQSASPHWTQ